MNKLKLFWITLILTSAVNAADLNFYLGNEVAFNKDIPTPSQFLGYQIGDWHIRHDQLVGYMKELAATSDRVTLEVIGYSHEQRPLIHLTITAPHNHTRIEEIRKDHLALSRGQGSAQQQPVVVWMGYSVHGNEASGSNAAPLMAYYLAAAQGIEAMLEETVIIFDPSLNPDGLDRFTNWVNANKGKSLVADGQTREHNETWPGGRTNHYWFDLNRDWLLMVHPESRARIERFHQWRPNIVTDHHEMGTNGSFFFQPGIPSRRNPLTPEKNVRLTELVGTYHAAAFDAAGKLYFTEQAFDDFYYGKGSTYPDIHGAVGILFEQASVRGHLRENSFGSLSLADAVKNQLTSSLSTFKAAYEQREALLKWQKEDALNVLREAANAKVRGYVFGEPEDPMRALIMARTLRRHGIEVHALNQPVRIGTQTLSQGYVVPTNQLQYRLIRSLFERVTKFGDNTFYDVSTWHFPSAFGVLCEAYELLPSDLVGPALEDPDLPAPRVSTEWGEAYAYAFSWHPYFSPRAAYRLMAAGVKLRYANKPFTAQTKYGEQDFDRGAILLPVGIQTLSSEQLDLLLKRVAGEDGIAVHAIRTGLTSKGIDLGSHSFAELKLPKIALVSGSGTAANSVGTLWHLLDARMDVPVTLLDMASMGRADLNVYTHLVLPNGKYDALTTEQVAKIKSWNEAGGSLVLLGNACKWAITHKLTSATLLADEKEGETVERLPFEEQAQRKAYERISGTAFSADLDLTHPLGFGFSRQRVALFRTSTMMLEPAKDAYGTVLQYDAAPLISGYVSATNLARLAGSAAVISHGQKQGQVVLIADPPNFRGYWLGTNKLFLNSLFFKPAGNR